MPPEATTSEPLFSGGLLGLPIFTTRNQPNELALFAGAGGGILGGKLLGWRTICAVEIDEYARRVLIARQDDGCLEPFPIWDDIRTFDGRPWRGVVDIISGGFPCQDISAAGRGAGIAGARSGLWSEMARIIREVGPRNVLVENSPMLTSRGLGRVLGDLAEMGYDASWGVLGAVDAGAPHRRDRIWIVADSQLPEWRQVSGARGGVARSHGVPQWQEGAGRAGVGGASVADADSVARDQGRTGDAAQGVRRRNADRGSEQSTNMADSTRERCGEAREYRPDESTQRASGSGETLPDPPSAGRETEWTATPQRSGDARPSGDVPGCASRERERERDDPNTLLDGLEGLHETRTTYGPSAGNNPGWWGPEPELGRVANELAGGMDGLNQGSET